MSLPIYYRHFGSHSLSSAPHSTVLRLPYSPLHLGQTFDRVFTLSLPRVDHHQQQSTSDDPLLTVEIVVTRNNNNNNTSTSGMNSNNNNTNTDSIHKSICKQSIINITTTEILYTDHVPASSHVADNPSKTFTTITTALSTHEVQYQLFRLEAVRTLQYIHSLLSSPPSHSSVTQFTSSADQTQRHISSDNFQSAQNILKTFINQITTYISTSASSSSSASTANNYRNNNNSNSNKDDVVVNPLMKLKALYSDLDGQVTEVSSQ